MSYWEAEMQVARLRVQQCDEEIVELQARIKEVRKERREWTQRIKDIAEVMEDK